MIKSKSLLTLFGIVLISVFGLEGCNREPLMPSESLSSPTPESTRLSTETIPFCGEEVAVTSEENEKLEGDLSMRWTSSGFIYRAILGKESGEMFVEYPSDSGGKKYVRQTMTFYNSPDGLIIQGANPVNPDTEQRVTNYAADSFLLQRDADRATMIVCDETGNQSPVSFETFDLEDLENDPDTLADSSEFIEDLERELEDFKQANSQAGLRELRDPFVGRIREGEVEVRNLQLANNTNYILVGVCDRDCRDLDLELYDENDGLIDNDFEDDDRPYVLVDPRWSGLFKLNVIMEDCSESICYYGIGVFAIEEE